MRTPPTRAKIPHDQDGALIAEPLRALTPPAARLHELQPRLGALVSREDRFLSGRAVSAITGDASKRKIRHWVDRGEFNSYALDGKTVYSEREVLAFLERVKAKGEPAPIEWTG